MSDAKPTTSRDPRPLAVLAALAAATSPDLGRDLFTKAKTALRASYDREPMDTVAATVALGALVFFRAERGTNPKVRSYWDALVYVSTNLSVGYCDIVAMTPAGKAVGSAIMTWGPSMAAGMLGPTRAEREGTAPTDARVVERLDRILTLLEERSKPPAPKPPSGV